MKKYQFKKLIRDKFFEHMTSDPKQKPDYRILNDEEYEVELKKKLIEESSEIEKTNDAEIVEEIADIYEIIDHILELKNISKEDVLKKQEAKREKAGSFSKKVFIESNTVEEGSDAQKIYLAQPEKYPEIIS